MKNRDLLIHYRLIYSYLHDLSRGACAGHFLMTRIDLLNLIITVLLLNLVVSCSSTKTVARYEFIPVENGRTETVLGIGDELEIDFHYWPEIGKITQTIRPDGKISLPYKDEIRTAGLTVQQLTDELTRIYSDLLKDPSITVIVKTFANREIYVGGEVWAPGRFPIKGKMTALQAVMAAGGFKNRSAAPDNVIVIRHHENKRYVTSVNMKDALEGTDNEPYYLAAQDIIFVPQTTIYKINLWVEQYLTNILTVSGFSFSYYPTDKWTLHIGN